VNCYTWNTALHGAKNLDTSESRSEMAGKVWNVVLKKAGEDQLDRSCEKWGSITHSQGGEECPTHNKNRRSNWIGNILRRNCLMKHIIEWKKEINKQSWKWREDEEKDVSSYSMILRKGECTGNWKKEHHIALCGELALEEAMDLS
jgi:hypothetical protein